MPAQDEDNRKAEQIADVGHFLQLADKYSDLQGRDVATVNELIEKIVIHSPNHLYLQKNRRDFWAALIRQY